LKKPTYYLWKSSTETQNDFEFEKKQYEKLGFRVVIFQDGGTDTNIHSGLKSLVKNHINDI
jgi:hypothetical protein